MGYLEIVSQRQIDLIGLEDILQFIQSVNDWMENFFKT